MRRVVVGLCSALSLLTLITPAGAASRASDDPARGRSLLTDRDHDLVDDVLERRIRGADPRARQAVVVATDGSLDVADARRAVGAFAVSRRLGLINGFSANLTAGQIRALAALPGVVRIDHDAVVRVTMDAARADYGVESARTGLGLTGSGVGMCILDTGVDPDHEQLDSKTIVWEDFIDGATTPYDDHGHGTHVASIAVGDGTGGAAAEQFGGVAPGAELWAGKVLDANGSGDESGIVAGIEWCASDPDVDIISMSLGTLLPSDGSDALSLAANAAAADGKVVIAAAGNSGDAPDSIAAPGAAADAITVGAVSEWSAAPGAPNHSDGIYLAYFSSRGGPTFDGDMKPDVVSPGVTITAAQANTAAAYITHSGTSMATPFAAGSAALALEAAPEWTGADLQAAIDATAEDFGPAGKDADWGAGLLDVYALTAAAAGASGETVFPTHVHVSGVVPDDGQWTHTFDLAEEDLGVPIAATIVIDQVCELDLDPFGCFQWGPDLDARLLDPNGVLLTLSQCMDDIECGAGRQETLHAMPTVAGTYEIVVFAFAGSPNDGAGGPFDLDLSTGPAGDATPPPPPPSPSMHVGDLDGTAVTLSSASWRLTVNIKVHDGDEIKVPGVLVTGHWGAATRPIQCTTGTGGACRVSKKFAAKRASGRFTVDSLVIESHDYHSADNHDPDGDSTGTSITVARP